MTPLINCAGNSISFTPGGNVHEGGALDGGLLAAVTGWAIGVLDAACADVAESITMRTAPNASADLTRILATLYEKARVYSRLIVRKGSDLAFLLGARQRHSFLGHRFQEFFVAVCAPEALEYQLRHLLCAEYGCGAP